LDLAPRRSAVVRKASDRVDEIGAVELTLELLPPLGQRASTEIATTRPKAIERHENRRRRDDRGVRLAEQMKPGNQLLVEDGHLAVEDERRFPESRDRDGEVREARGMVDALTAHEADATTILQGQHAPAVDLLLVHPARGGGRA